MLNNSIIIIIHSVFVTQRFHFNASSWAKELKGVISETAEQNGCKLISISDHPDLTHLVKAANPGSFRDSLENDPPQSGPGMPNFFEAAFYWNIGSGYSCSVSGPGQLNEYSPVISGLIHKHWLIDKYLEFLSRFNTAYDDNLYMNISLFMSANRPA